MERGVRACLLLPVTTAHVILHSSVALLQQLRHAGVNGGGYETGDATIDFHYGVLRGGEKLGDKRPYRFVSGLGAGSTRTHFCSSHSGVK